MFCRIRNEPHRHPPTHPPPVYKGPESGGGDRVVPILLRSEGREVTVFPTRLFKLIVQETFPVPLFPGRRLI